MILIGITGHAQHGKDTVARFLMQERGFRRYAFGDQIKELALRLNPLVDFGGEDDFDYSTKRLRDYVAEVGWETAKNNGEVRRFLVQLGNGGRDLLGQDVWIRALELYMHEQGYHGKTDRVVISDVRLPNEARWVRAGGGDIWKVIRPGYNNGVDPNDPTERYIDDIVPSRQVKARTVKELEMFAARAQF